MTKIDSILGDIVSAGEGKVSSRPVAVPLPSETLSKLEKCREWSHRLLGDLYDEIVAGDWLVYGSTVFMLPIRIRDLVGTIDFRLGQGPDWKPEWDFYAPNGECYENNSCVACSSNTGKHEDIKPYLHSFLKEKYKSYANGSAKDLTFPLMQRISQGFVYANTEKMQAYLDLKYDNSQNNIVMPVLYYSLGGLKESLIIRREIARHLMTAKFPIEVNGLDRNGQETSIKLGQFTAIRDENFSPGNMSFALASALSVVKRHDKFPDVAISVVLPYGEWRGL